MKTEEIIANYSTNGWAIETATHVICRGEQKQINRSPAHSGDPIVGNRVYAVNKTTLKEDNILLKYEDILKTYGQ